VSESAGYLYFNESGSPVLADLKLDPGTIQNPVKCETTKYQTLFWVALDSGGETVPSGELSLSVQQKGSSRTFDLTQSAIKLRRGTKEAGEVSRWAFYNGAAAAIVKFNTTLPKPPIPSRTRSLTVVYEPNYESLSKEQRESLVDKLSVNNKIAKDYDEFDVDSGGELLIDWTSMGASGKPLSITMNCTSGPCPTPVPVPAIDAVVTSEVGGRVHPQIAS
jgi:hypothetical protein